MAHSNTQIKLSFKLMVDIKSKKVVFAEADKDFVDFIFNLMSLPLSSVTKILLLNKKGTLGSLGSLYESIESLGAQYFEPNVKKDAVLKPRRSVTVPLLSLHEWPASTSGIFKCVFHDKISDVQGSHCCGCALKELPYSFIPPNKAGLGYVKGTVVFMVIDNLEVKPMSIALIKTLVRDFDVLEEKQVEVGLQEGLAILKASMETSTVLTSVFFKKK